MRIYSDPMEAIREVERDVWTMGINVHPQTMQDKDVGGDENYLTKEIQGYGFKIVNWRWNPSVESKFLEYFYNRDRDREALAHMRNYVDSEFSDRLSGFDSRMGKNPGHSYTTRPEVWQEFLHGGKFSYTYSERLAPQLSRIFNELLIHPETRQAVLNIHTNICPDPGFNFLGASAPQTPHRVAESPDWINIGGTGRIPCSMYYQLMRRLGRLNLIYTMRSCDLITHFPIDIMLALRLQTFCADWLTTSKPDDSVRPGTFTYFTGSLHAYKKDLVDRGIF